MFFFNFQCDHYETKKLFEEQYEAYINQIKTIEDINDSVYAEYVDGYKLNKILTETADDDLILKSLMMQQFENVYSYQEREPLILEEHDVDFKLDGMKFLVHECKLLFVIIICIKSSYDEMQIAQEKEEIERQEMEHEAKPKSKKSKKDKKKKEVEEVADIDEEQKSVEPPELRLMNAAPEHVASFFDQIKNLQF